MKRKDVMDRLQGLYNLPAKAYSESSPQNYPAPPLQVNFECHVS